MRVPFETIWKRHVGGVYTNNRKIRISGITANKDCIEWKKGRSISFGGIDWSLFIGRDIDIKEDGDIAVITGIY